LPTTPLTTLKSIGFVLNVSGPVDGGVPTGTVRFTVSVPEVPGAPSTVIVHEPVTPRRPSATDNVDPEIEAVTGMVVIPLAHNTGFAGSVNGPLYPGCEICAVWVDPSTLKSPKLIGSGTIVSAPTAGPGDAEAEATAVGLALAVAVAVAVAVALGDALAVALGDAEAVVEGEADGVAVMVVDGYGPTVAPCLSQALIAEAAETAINPTRSKRPDFIVLTLSADLCRGNSDPFNRDRRHYIQ
jgi:hypothetical protein